MRALIVLFALVGTGSGLHSRVLPTKVHRAAAPSQGLVMKEQQLAQSAAGALFLATTLASAQPASAGEIEAGAGVFSGNCAACHAGGNNVIVSQKTLRKEALIEYLSGGYKEASIVTQVRGTKKTQRASQSAATIELEYKT